ncbi:phage tail protein [Lysobacter sp. CA199]|uniref:phage tail protein n=1 Tax=Lysobacter sp. CA199 TaxID=3455608 RepID=UPI003F8D8587
MMMALGTFVFSLSTLAYDQFQRSTSWRHPGSDRVGARAARQYVGPGDDTIRLSGLIAPDLTGTPISLDVLRGMANTGEVFALVEGTGMVYGGFVIGDLNETRTLLFADGAARRIEFDMTLVRADDDSELDQRGRA